MLRADLATPADMALCRQMIRQGSKSFHLASLLMPRKYREPSRALYGFCRMADDLVDKSSDPRTATAELARRLDHIYAGIPEDSPTDRAFADAVRRFAIPRAVPDALIEGFVWDAQGRSCQTRSDVTAYAVRVAGTVGVMMSLIMGERSASALARAIDLGVAMQFSNIARDVEEDAVMGRCYLPLDWLAGQSPAAAAGRLVREAEGLYARAAFGITRLPRSCRAAINAARHLYRAIGLQAVAQGHRGRAVVPGRRKLLLLCKALAETPFLPHGENTACLEEAQFLLDAVAQGPRPAAERHKLSEQVDWIMQMFISVEVRKP